VVADGAASPRPATAATTAAFPVNMILSFVELQMDGEGTKPGVIRRRAFP
jgi:hypothetical protein